MNAIIFFNGWGMNENVIEDLKIPENFIVKTLTFPYLLEKEQLKEFENIYFVGWSFGVYYLSKFLSENSQIKYKKIISINGTPEIIGKFGIEEKIYNLTLRNMDEKNIEKFYINIGYKSKSNEKNIENLIEELKYLKENYRPQNNYISTAIIGEKDITIPTKNQIKFYEKEKTNIIKLPISHFPFYYLDSWEKIINIDEG
ncbi:MULTISPECIES: pimeloyl-ACP methyl esterase BioG family protein [Fusobacterium]|uniref:pimeloyl-ACP methyl esterase BioG family protein n=1 Tax=Fusobacterium TaxID=848 RepID=UPI00147714E3|nr:MULTISPECIES: pimeloyl-ACP methyl esterase BioG family protein [Fusobacterium]NME35614.1 DUF452 family protein [Fusobacterium sp. FSA-380-WT-3A]